MTRYVIDASVAIKWFLPLQAAQNNPDGVMPGLLWCCLYTYGKALMIADDINYRKAHGDGQIVCVQGYVL